MRAAGRDRSDRRGVERQRPGGEVAGGACAAAIYLNQLAPPVAGRPPRLDLTDALITLARQVHATLVRETATPFAALLQAYDRRHALVGRTVRIVSTGEPAVRGRCAGLDDAGRLLGATAREPTA